LAALPPAQSQHIVQLADMRDLGAVKFRHRQEQHNIMARILSEAG
jgi:hypothetical protein